MRIIVVEATVIAEGRLAQIEFKTTAIQPLTQNIPLVRQLLDTVLIVIQ